jgi:prepilin-type N-terminal cleavage/methylation domain-containing protein
MCVVNQCRKKSKKGLSLIELVISLGVFGIVTVVMSGTVVNLASLAHFLDRRNDFLVEVESAVGVIRNDIRNARKVGVCNANNNPYVGPNILTQGIYIVRRDGGNNPTPITSAIHIDNQSRLVLARLQGNPEQTQNQCVLNTSSNPQYLVSQNIKVQNLDARISQDQKGENSVIYILFEACDADDVVNKIFTCRSPNGSPAKPFRYIFAISTRTI